MNCLSARYYSVKKRSDGRGRSQEAGRVSLKVVGLIEGNENISVVPCSISLDSSDTSQLPDQENCSAAAPPVAERWSSDAIARCMQERPARQDKLKRAGCLVIIQALTICKSVGMTRRCE